MPSGERIPGQRRGRHLHLRGRPAPGHQSRTGRCAARAVSWSRPAPATCCTWCPVSRMRSPSSRTWAGRRQLRKAGDAAGAVSALDSALSLWRGIAFGGVPGPFAETERVRLGELCARRRRRARRRAPVARPARGGRARPDRDGGRPPAARRMRGLLMVALYRCGRHARRCGYSPRAAGCWPRNWASIPGRRTVPHPPAGADDGSRPGRPGRPGR